MNPRRNRQGTADFNKRSRAIVPALALLPWLLLAGTATEAAPPEDETAAAPGTRIEATYSIIIRGITLGHAKAETRLVGTDYAIAVKGTISGILRIFSDASADMVGRGRIDGTRILPSAYNFLSVEGKNEMRVTIALDNGNVTDFSAAPPPKPSPTRVPITEDDKRAVVDPMSALIFPVDPLAKVDGDTACNRTIKVFDGWQRFDLRLSYKETRKVKGRKGGYAGEVYRCGIGFVPVSGHNEGKGSQTIAENKRIEVWLAPVAGAAILAPYKIVVGDTNLGDLVVVATRFVVRGPDDRASTN